MVGQQLIPVPSLCDGELLEHAFKGLIKALHQSVSLGVVDRGAQLGDVEEVTHLVHDLRHKAGPLVSQDFIRQTYPAGYKEQLLGVFCGCVIHHRQHVPVATGRLQQGTQDVHADPPEGGIYDGQGVKVALGNSP